MQSHSRGGYILHALSLEFPEPPFADVPRLGSPRCPRNSYARLATLFGESALPLGAAKATRGDDLAGSSFSFRMELP